MTYFVRNGNLYRPMDEMNLDLHKILPAGNYILKQDQNGNIFLEVVDNFEFSTKRYGSNPRYTKRILDTFMDRDKSTGVMLTGEKGSGKSLLAKTVSIEAYKMGIPTIIINSPWRGDAFNSFIQGIEQPAIVLFDEFEKVYDSEEQEGILTLLDGVFPSKKLFILTCNDKWRVDSHMRNRPGRIFYMIDFKGLEKSFIVEYCRDNLSNKQYTDKICTIATMFSQFNFDMLKALVEEMNRYGETPEQALEMLNSRPEFSDSSRFDVSVTVNGIEANPIQLNWTGNPLTDKLAIEYYAFKQKKGKGSDTPDNGTVTAIAIAPAINPRMKKRLGNKISEMEYDFIEMSHTHLIAVNSENGTFTYKKDSVVITLTRSVERSVNYYDMD